MRGVLALFSCLAAALVPSGCRGRTAPVTVTSQCSLDTIAYGQSCAAAPAPIPVAYAEPAPVRYNAAYHLDAGDILGEVAAPGQYPYVPNMTDESAVAITGGFVGERWL